MSHQLDISLDADWRTSPNFEERKDGLQPNILLMHYTGMDSAQAAIDRLCDEAAGVSSHYLVDEKGVITQMVREEHRAWHAGKSYWSGSEDVNSLSIGIEIANLGHGQGYPQFPPEQMQAVTALSLDIINRHNIPAHRVIGHSDVAPGRKQDPGEKFDWASLHKSGIGHWVSSEPIKNDAGLQIGAEGEAVLHLQNQLAAYGYRPENTGKYSQATFDTVKAFQQHFRQEKADGVADASTLKTLGKLIAALPEETIKAV